MDPGADPSHRGVAVESDIDVPGFFVQNLGEIPELTLAPTVGIEGFADEAGYFIEKKRDTGSQAFSDNSRMSVRNSGV